MKQEVFVWMTGSSVSKPHDCGRLHDPSQSDVLSREHEFETTSSSESKLCVRNVVSIANTLFLRTFSHYFLKIPLLQRMRSPMLGRRSCTMSVLPRTVMRGVNIVLWKAPSLETRSCEFLTRSPVFCISQGYNFEFK